MAHRIVGLDLGSDTFRAVEVQGAGTPHPVITAHHQVSVPAGVVDSGEIVDAQRATALIRQLWSEGGLHCTDVVLGIGNARVLVRELTVPQATARQVQNSLPFHVQDLLTVPVAEAILDFYPVAGDVLDGAPVLHGLLVAAVKESVNTTIRAVAAAGLTTLDVDLIPFALARLHSDPSVSAGRNIATGDPGTVALIDIGARTTTVIISTGAVPRFVRLIPVGGADLTRMLADTLGIDAPEADTLKRRIGLTDAAHDPHDTAAVGVIHGFCGDLLDAIHNTLRYYASAHPDSPASTLVLRGGGSELSGLGDALAEISRLPIRPVDPYAAVSVSAKLHRAGGRLPASLAVALGLALGTPGQVRRPLGRAA